MRLHVNDPLANPEEARNEYCALDLETIQRAGRDCWRL